MSRLPSAPVAAVEPEPAPHLATRYAPLRPVDLRATLGPLVRGTGDPTARWEPGGLWRTFGTPFGPATVYLTQSSREVEAVAWGPGAQWAIDGVPELLGAGDDWAELDVSAYPVLVEVRRRRAGLRLTRTRRVFEALMPAVIEQRVTSLDAYRCWSRMVRRFGDPAPGPAPEGMRVCPAAETVQRIPSWEWHTAGIDPGRARTIVGAAGVADALERTTRHDRAEADKARTAMRSLPGIGVWTAAETAQRAHGDPDAVSFGDYSLAAIVGQVLIGTPVDDDGMLELLEPWPGQRQRVVRLVLASGIMPPRRAPRARIEDHRHR
ncbi:MAG TPA: DNA-3-methyladenine glycosylase 2 family protein [Humibacter sp.]|nr:DNA-3-methyladenine glycosylase 2 family protein [Humibacter sp.]